MMKIKDLLFIAISFFTLVFIWIVFNIYHNIVTSTIPESTNIQIAPIEKNFDTKIIDALKRREKIIPIFDLKSNQVPVATQEASQTVATSSGATP